MDKRLDFFKLGCCWVFYILFRLFFYNDIISNLLAAQLEEGKDITAKIRIFSFLVDLFPIILIVLTVIKIILYIKEKGNKL
jgi:hypothetical protein